MKKTMTALFIAASILFTALSLPVARVYAETATETLVYIALGDSVTAGYGLAEPEDDNCMTLFAALLESDGYTLDYLNAGYDGLTSAGLLAGLKKLNDDELSILRGADIITLNIGGNDLLGPLKTFILDTGVNYAEPQLADLFKLLFFEFSEAQATLLEDTLEAFAKTFAEIVAFLGEMAPDAVLIIDTVYNPLPLEGLVVSESAEALIAALNVIITQTAEEAGAILADVGGAFAAAAADGARVVNFSLFAAPISVDIHPNAEGHKLIAELLYDAWISLEE